MISGHLHCSELVLSTILLLHVPVGLPDAVCSPVSAGSGCLWQTLPQASNTPVFLKMEMMSLWTTYCLWLLLQLWLNSCCTYAGPATLIFSQSSNHSVTSGVSSLLSLQLESACPWYFLLYCSALLGHLPSHPTRSLYIELGSQYLLSELMITPQPPLGEKQKW